MNQEWVIYGLRAPGEDRIRYVGFSRCPHNRLLQHESKARNMNRRPVYCWIRSLLTKRVRPEMVILEKGSGPGWQAAEQKWIAAIPDLFNISIGGEAPAIPDESRKRAGEKLKHRSFSPEHRARISAANMGRLRPDNVARNQAQAKKNTGKKMIFSEAGKASKYEQGHRLASGNSERWASMPPEERARRSQMAREQMKRVWAQRKQEAA